VLTAALPGQVCGEPGTLFKPSAGSTAPFRSGGNRRPLSGTSTYVTMTYMTGIDAQINHDEARQRLIEAQDQYQRNRGDAYVILLVRDAAIVDAHRAGLSSREISTLVGDIGQPNVVRARRRAVTRREVVPDGLLSPADALRASGLGPKEFIDAVRSGRLRQKNLPGGASAFRAEDVRQLSDAG
jgi:hypothetical protein